MRSRGRCEMDSRWRRDGEEEENRGRRSVEKQVQQTAELVDKLRITDLQRAQSTASAKAGMQHVSPQVKPHQSQEEKVQTREEDEDIETPVELKMKFLKAVQGGDYELACKLCQMILTFEPENPEASEFLPLIKKKLLEEQSSEEEEEDGDDESDNEDG
ncbi:glutamate-rich protein 2 [Halichoeres trimaculatus]|uniref:glutamate-rich protein 2 n=1 Tax=Halichoeres trimaculatus TaxID=147232 RepID=UPI003D9E4C7E